ncbi:hypothetical protein SAMN02745174_00914 [Cetobacterium ceti]|uniref:Uncharacterized protein n=1 Tax=Cetobacterium ceti TaxID=180163 RepID=A0A1T4LLY6_9FUSO|nr:hypothetical protein [Cetobacterium ceti]SJZ55725.1 hypothetical protein SAMN02745174_00914 [Cetobacterium ceti]
MAKNPINVLEKLKKDSFKKKEIETQIIEKEYKVTFIEENIPQTLESNFNYDLINDITMRKDLLSYEIALNKAKSTYHSTAGEILYTANLKYAKNKNGIFTQWLNYLNINKKTAERLINRFKFLKEYCVTEDLKEYFESLPLSLTYEVSSPNADKILIEALLNKKITTRKEFLQLKNSIKDVSNKKPLIESDLFNHFQKLNNEISIYCQKSLDNNPNTKDTIEKILNLNNEILSLLNSLK